jgi:hypothetical protein
MKRNFFSPLCIAILALAGNALAQQPAPPAAPAPVPDTIKAIAPFLDPQVMAVVRIDAAKIDLKVAEDWVAARMREGGDKNDKRIDEFVIQMAAQRAEGEKMLGAFRDAGGRDAYVVISTTDMFAGAPPVIIPLPPGADGDKISALFPPSAGLERINNILVLGPEPTRARLKEMLKTAAPKPIDPNLLAAIGTATPDAAIHVALAPSIGVRAVFSQLAPTLPPQLGGGPTAPVLRGLRWATFTLQMPPTPSLRVFIQAENPQAAEAIEKVLHSGLAAGSKAFLELAALPKNAGEAESMKRFAEMVPTIAPKRDGDRLAIVLGEQNVKEMTVVATSGILRARAQAMQVQSMSQMRQLLMACQIWSAEHKREWPDDLASAIESASLPATIASNPAKPGTGYTYIKPPKDAKDASSRIALYAEETIEGGRGVGFMDGHAEWMKEEHFQETLKKQNAEVKK